MILEQTVTWLEMTSPDQLRPGRPPPEPVELVPAGPPVARLLAETTTRVGRPHDWTTRPAWSAARWAEHLARPGVAAWLARVGGEPAGVIEVEGRSPVEVPTFRRRGIPFAFWVVAPLPPDARPLAFTSFDAAGQRIARRTQFAGFVAGCR